MKDRLTQPLTEKTAKYLKEMGLPTFKYEPKGDANIPDCVDKLGKLEDIEEELGIDLITLFKALKNGVWSTLSYSDINRMRYEKRQNQKYFYYDNVSITKDNLLINSSGDDTWGSYVIKFADYGKTWALTKEGLK